MAAMPRASPSVSPSLRDAPRARERGAIGDDRGSGSVLAIALAAAVLVLAGLVLPLNAALTTRQIVANAADAAALAAADTASGLVTGDPCENAERAARLNGAIVVECAFGGDGATSGLEATVSVERTVLGLSVRMSARAGPPTAG